MIRAAGFPTVLLAGGGTGGHLFPGVAVAERLRARMPGARVVLAATRRDAGSAHAAVCGLEEVDVRSPPLPHRATGLPAFGARMAGAIGRALRTLAALDPDVVVGLGGYGSVAPCVAARTRGLPVLLLEQNAVPGVATRWLSRTGAVTAASFPGLRERGVRGRVVLTGNPVRRAVLATRAAHAELGLVPARPVLAVLGGSLGAKGLNERVAHAAAALVEAVGAGAPFQVLHAAGSEEQALLAARAWRASGVHSVVRPFFDDMGAVWGTADAVLCRAGGTTVAELTALGLPAVLVPYPHHRDDHQAENARPLVARGAATLLREEHMTPRTVAEHLAPLLRDPAERAWRGRAARRLGAPEAAETVVDLLLELAGRRGSVVCPEVTR